MIGFTTLPQNLLRRFSEEQIVAAWLSPVGLASMATNGTYRLPWHLAQINRKLMQVEAGLCKRLLIAAPPRHGKSELVSNYFPPHYLGRFPDRRVILASYESSLARRSGRHGRDVLAAFGPDLFRVNVARRSSAANQWDIEGRAGGMITAGRGAGLTGKGANLLVIDDPLKDNKEANSATIREGLWTWFQSVAYTRLAPNAAIVVMATRWHEDDLTGRLLRDETAGGDKWDKLFLPAVEDGVALWPEQYPMDALEEKKRMIGSYFWSAMYQQQPQPSTGTIFKREHFRYYDEVEGVYHLYNLDGTRRSFPVENCWKFQTCDPAATEKEENDFFVLDTWAVTPQADLILVDVFRDHAATTRHLDIMRSQFLLHRPVVQGVENKTFGLNIIQAARLQGLPIVPLKADVDKVARSRTIAARFEAGQVFFRRGAAWLTDRETELTSFPKGRYDDAVDTTSYGGIVLATSLAQGQTTTATIVQNNRLTISQV